MKIFISHSHKDKEIVRRLTNDLRKYDLDVWLDEDLISPGDQWADKINESLDKSDVVLVIMSNNTAESRFQNSEIAFAIASQRKNPSKLVIPVLVDKRADVPFFLKDVLYCDLSSNEKYDHNLKSLIQTLSKPLESPRNWEDSDLKRIETIKAEKQMLQYEENKLNNSKAIWTSTVLGALSSVVAALVTYFIGLTASSNNQYFGDFVSFIIQNNRFFGGVVVGATCSIVAFFVARKFQNKTVRKEGKHGK